MSILFEDFVLDPARREFTRCGAEVTLEPQVFDLLVYLVREREHVVNKDELIHHVWKGRLVSDSTIESRLCLLRKALNDDGHHQRLIRTYARKGVRFVGAVALKSTDVTNGGDMTIRQNLFLSTILAFGSAQAVAQTSPVPIEINGQKALVFIQQDPPGTRCNTNMQIAAEIMNIYQVPVVLMPQHAVPKFTPAPSVWYGGQVVAASGAQHNGMVSFTIVADQLDMDGAPKHGKSGKLFNASVRPGFEQLKDVIKTGQ